MMDGDVLDATPLFEAERAQRRRARLLPYTMFDEIEPNPIKSWLVHGLFGKGELSAVYGAPGSGKSVLCGDLAFHVAAGLPWFGRRVLQSPVLYVAAERPGLVKRRFAALRGEHGLTAVPLALVPATIDLRHREAKDSLIATAEDVQMAVGAPLGLIIIDTLNQAMMGGDENSASDMGLFLSNVQRLQRETAAHVLLIHHSPIESPNRLRGHSSLLAALDTSVLVRKTGAARTADVVKANDGAEDESVSFDMRGVSVGVDSDGSETWAPIVIPAERDSVTERDKSQMSRLPASVENARRALVNAIADHGRKAPDRKEFPTGVQAITIEQWRDFAYRSGITNSDDPAAKRQAFKRVNEQLKARGLMGEWEGLVWSVMSVTA